MGRPPSESLKRFDPIDVVVLRMLSEGAPLRTIARVLGCSERTVRRRIRHVCEAFGVRTPIEAVVAAVRRGVV